MLEELQARITLELGCRVGAAWVRESEGRSTEELQHKWNDEQEAWVRKCGFVPTCKDGVVRTRE